MGMMKERIGYFKLCAWVGLIVSIFAPVFFEQPWSPVGFYDVIIWTLFVMIIIR